MDANGRLFFREVLVVPVDDGFEYGENALGAKDILNDILLPQAAPVHVR